MNNATLIRLRKLLVKLLIGCAVFVGVVYLVIGAFLEKILLLEAVYAILYFGVVIALWLGFLSLVGLIVMFVAGKWTSFKHLK